MKHKHFFVPVDCKKFIILHSQSVIPLVILQMYTINYKHLSLKTKNCENEKKMMSEVLCEVPLNEELSGWS